MRAMRAMANWFGSMEPFITGETIDLIHNLLLSVLWNALEARTTRGEMEYPRDPTE